MVASRPEAHHAPECSSWGAQHIRSLDSSPTQTELENSGQFFLVHSRFVDPPEPHHPYNVRHIIENRVELCFFLFIVAVGSHVPFGRNMLSSSEIDEIAFHLSLSLRILWCSMSSVSFAPTRTNRIVPLFSWPSIRIVLSLKCSAFTCNWLFFLSFRRLCTPFTCPWFVSTNYWLDHIFVWSVENGHIFVFLSSAIRLYSCRFL